MLAPGRNSGKPSMDSREKSNVANVEVMAAKLVIRAKRVLVMATVLIMRYCSDEDQIVSRLVREADLGMMSD